MMMTMALRERGHALNFYGGIVFRKGSSPGGWWSENMISGQAITRRREQAGWGLGAAGL